MKCWLEQLLGQHLGQYIGDTDSEAKRPGGDAPLSVPIKSCPKEKISSA
jgi:hypothetical protein